MASVTNIINDGNAAGTQIVEATVSGDGTSAVSLKNDGTLVLGNSTHPGSISSDNTAFHTDGSGNVTAHNISATGTLTVSGTSTFTGGLSGTGFTSMSVITVVVSTNGQTINHGLGATPTFIWDTNTTSPDLAHGLITSINSTSFQYFPASGATGHTFTFASFK